MRLRFLRLEEMVCWGEGEKENSLGLLDERCEKANEGPISNVERQR